VEFREHADRIELVVDLINESAVPGDAALGIPKRLHDALKNVTRSANKQVSQCHFAVRVRETNAQLDSDVLKRIDGDIPPRDGFRSWYKRRPAPPAPAPAPGAAVSDRTSGEVSVVLGLELSNLRSEFHAAVSIKDLDSCCSKALTTLELLHKYMLGLAASPAPAVSGTPALPSPCAKSNLPASLLTPGRLFQARTLLLAQQTRPRPTPLHKTPPAQLAPWPVRPPLPCCPAAVSPDALS